MKSKFDAILARGLAAGKLPGLERSSRVWYRNQARILAKATPEKVLEDADGRRRGKNAAAIGKMYFFAYDPKHKKTLPYYDKFPLVFPFQRQSDGFVGINLHYLPYQLRARLMDALYDLKSTRGMTDRTRLKVTYDVLNGAAKYRLFRPTVHRYLGKHIRSSLVEVRPDHWDMALFLPVHDFAKASASKVWTDSMRRK